MLCWLRSTAEFSIEIIQPYPLVSVIDFKGGRKAAVVEFVFPAFSPFSQKKANCGGPANPNFTKTNNRRF